MKIGNIGGAAITGVICELRKESRFLSELLDELERIEIEKYKSKITFASDDANWITPELPFSFASIGIDIGHGVGAGIESVEFVHPPSNGGSPLQKRGRSKPSKRPFQQVRNMRHYLTMLATTYQRPPMNSTPRAQIRALRLAQGLTQQELAERLNVSQATIANVERGRRSPSVKTLEKYAAALGCELVIEFVKMES